MKYLEILIRDTAAEAREARRRERIRQAWIQRAALAAIVVALAVCIAIMAGCAARGSRESMAPEAVATSAVLGSMPPVIPGTQPPSAAVKVEPEQEPETAELDGPTWPDVPMMEEAAAWAGPGEDPLEHEKIVEALLAQCYFSDAVPMCYEYQDLMRTFCAKYGCPYPLALAVAEVESHFDMDAVGKAGEVGIMQLNPGPGGSYHAELEAATGMDPTTPAGNIAGGCYLLGKYLAEFEDPATAVMAYRMGHTGAKKALAAGVDPLKYAGADMEAMERWECTVNAWRGE